jgi:hypothetical protein
MLGMCLGWGRNVYRWRNLLENDHLELKGVVCRITLRWVGGSDSGSCPTAGFGVSGVVPSGSAIRVLHFIFKQHNEDQLQLKLVQWKALWNPNDSFNQFLFTFCLSFVLF